MSPPAQGDCRNDGKDFIGVCERLLDAQTKEDYPDDHRQMRIRVRLLRYSYLGNAAQGPQMALPGECSHIEVSPPHRHYNTETDHGRNNNLAVDRQTGCTDADRDHGFTESNDEDQSVAL